MPDSPAENWQETFARMGIFSLLLFVLTAFLRRGTWTYQVAPPQVVNGIRNWALILFVAALPLYAWSTWRKQGGNRWRIELRGTALLFGITLGGLCLILLLRAAMLNVGLSTQRTLLLRCIQALDLAAALILPMISGFTLIMLPQISFRGMWRATKIVAGCCLVAMILLAVTTHLTAVHAAPRRTPTPIDRPPSPNSRLPVTGAIHPQFPRLGTAFIQEQGAFGQKRA
jgi:hypothetical protein